MKKKSNSTWARDIQGQPAKLRQALGTKDVSRAEAQNDGRGITRLKITSADIERAELELDMAKLEPCPKPERIKFFEGIVAELKVEARLGGNGSAAKAKGRQSQPIEPRLSDRASAERALSDPAKYPTMTPKEVMAALHLKKVVYEHPKLVRASTGTRNVRFTTASVKAIRESSPE